MRFSFPHTANEYRECYDKARLPIMLIGYARVSTGDQNLELQLAALTKASCKPIFTDKISGAKADRPGLRETLSHLRETDTLVVWKLDRLGRSVKGLVDLVNELQERHVHFKSLTDGIDTKTAAPTKKGRDASPCPFRTLTASSWLTSLAGEFERAPLPPLSSIGVAPATRAFRSLTCQ
jgi:Resolvase, N terminal domain